MGFELVKVCQRAGFFLIPSCGFIEIRSDQAGDHTVVFQGGGAAIRLAILSLICYFFAQAGINSFKT